MLPKVDEVDEAVHLLGRTKQTAHVRAWRRCKKKGNLQLNVATSQELEISLSRQHVFKVEPVVVNNPCWILVTQKLGILSGTSRIHPRVTDWISSRVCLQARRTCVQCTRHDSATHNLVVNARVMLRCHHGASTFAKNLRRPRFYTMNSDAESTISSLVTDSMSATRSMMRGARAV